MSFANYKISNNANSKLIAGISASATTILITDGDQNIMPSEFPFLLTIEHEDSSGNVTVREIVKVNSMNSNSLVVERGAGTCVQDDTASNRTQANTPHSFDAGDKISLYFTSEQVKDIQTVVNQAVKSSAIASEYSTTTSYAVGDIVMYEGTRYVCNTATSGSFDVSKWTAITVQSSIDDTNDNIDGIDSRVDTLETQVSTLGKVSLVDILVVGGGGGGAPGYSGSPARGGGGGGGGEVKEVYQTSLIKTSTSVIIGDGGNQCTKGCNSYFGGITAIGGGGGGGCVCVDGVNGAVGYSGGGYYGGYNELSGCTRMTHIGPNNWGGSGKHCNSSYGRTGGGGGGAGGCGGRLGPLQCYMQCWAGELSMIGGVGIGTCFTGIAKYLGGGGGGGGDGYIFHCVNCTACHSTITNSGYCYGGGTGGGGTKCGCDGTANTGGGGGGGSQCGCAGGCGGSGLVVVRYPTDGSYGITCATGGTISTATINGKTYCIHCFTTNGTFTVIS